MSRRSREARSSHSDVRGVIEQTRRNIEAEARSSPALTLAGADSAIRRLLVLARGYRGEPDGLEAARLDALCDAIENEASAVPLRPDHARPRSSHSDVSADLRPHVPWARAIFAEERLWLACECGWNVMGGESGSWMEHLAAVSRR